MKKNKEKLIFISIFAIAIISLVIFLHTFFMYLEKKNDLNSTLNNKQNIQEEEEKTNENSTIITIDKDSSIRVIEQYDETMFKGHKSIIFFWASWCSHCREEIPVLKTVISDYKDKGYNIYLISHDNEIEELSNFMKSEDLNYEVFFDKQRVIRANFDPEASSVPLTYIIDENAKLVDSYNGAITLKDLNDLLDKNM